MGNGKSNCRLSITKESDGSNESREHHGISFKPFSGEASWWWID